MWELGEAEECEHSSDSFIDVVAFRIILKPRQFSNDGEIIFLLFPGEIVLELFIPALPFADEFKPKFVDYSENCLSIFILVNLMPSSLLKSFNACSYCC